MSGLNTTISLDAGPYEKNLARVEKMTMDMVKRSQERIAAGTSPSSWQVQRDANRMMGSPTGSHRGAWGGAASSMFVSVGRDTAASLASGANPLTVIMQQAPQVLQALTMMDIKLKGLIGTLGALAAVVGTALAGLHFFNKAMFSLAGDNPTFKFLEKRLDQMRHFYKERREEAKKEMEENQKILELKIKIAEAQVKSGDDLAKARMETRAMEAKTPEEARAIRLGYLKDQVESAKLDYDSKKHDLYNQADPKKQEAAVAAAIAFEHAKQALLQFQSQNQADVRSEGKSSSTSPGGHGASMLTEWEQAGGSLGAMSQILDVSRASLNELRQINRSVSRLPDRGGTFGR